MTCRISPHSLDYQLKWFLRYDFCIVIAIKSLQVKAGGQKIIEFYIHETAQCVLPTLGATFS